MAEAHVILDEWRRAERFLRLLPPTAPERPDVEERADELRVLFHQLTSTRDATVRRLASTRQTIERSQVLLDAVAKRYGLPANAPIDEPASGGR